MISEEQIAELAHEIALHQERGTNWETEEELVALLRQEPEDELRRLAEAVSLPL